MKRAPRYKTGSLVLDRRRKTWNLLTWENGKRRTHRIGTLAEYPSKSAARRAAQAIQREIPKPQPQANTGVPTVSTLAEQYNNEKMPERKDTRRTYASRIRLHILPKWGEHLITDVQAAPVERWLESLPLAPKSRGHIRGLLSSLWNYAMWKQAIPVQVNPMGLVTVKGASKRRKQPRSLTVEQFRLLLSHLHEPHGTIALMCICFGFRISECLALRWSDVDWLNKRLRVERGIVEGNVDDTKTDESRNPWSSRMSFLRG